MPRQKLTTYPFFRELSEEDQYELLQDTELRVQRLERIALVLVAWREGSPMYEEVCQELREYLG